MTSTTPQQLIQTDSQATTEGIHVSVRARFSPEHSDPERPLFFFLYEITIDNESTRTVMLLDRHWEITDAAGKVEHVRGPGVVGEQPILSPGDSFKYTSGCPLTTRFGFMKGEYGMLELTSQRRLEVEVAGFPLRIEAAAPS